MVSILNQLTVESVIRSDVMMGADHHAPPLPTKKGTNRVDLCYWRNLVGSVMVKADYYQRIDSLEKLVVQLSRWRGIGFPLNDRNLIPGFFSHDAPE
jgi:hypothetical protein